MSRRTANGWQAVSFRGRALDQYRTEFLEKRSHHSSDSTSREASLVIKKKRRVAADGAKLSDSSRESSAESGSSRCSFSEISPTQSVRKTEGLTTRRLRPSRSWFDTLPDSAKRKTSTPPTVVVSCGMNVTNECGEAIDEEDGEQDLKVNMWIKKALNKRHKEECGMT